MNPEWLKTIGYFWIGEIILFSNFYLREIRGPEALTASWRVHLAFNILYFGGTLILALILGSLTFKIKGWLRRRANG